MIELPKDAEGREISLDTKFLYDEDGREFKVDRFTYSVTQLISDLKWGVVFDDCSVDYCCAFHLTPPDSWEKLEEDFDRCIEESNSCWYFSPGGDCFKCDRPDSDTCGCTASVFKDIKRRIRRLRGEN